MALQLIQNTDANTCSTDSFLDSLCALEHIDESSPRLPQPPPSPVFRAPSEPYPHFDVYGWNIKARPGRPVGGEATALRAVYSYLESRYAQS